MSASGDRALRAQIRHLRARLKTCSLRKKKKKGTVLDVECEETYIHHDLKTGGA